MLIRSQNKKNIINVDNAEMISICGYKVDNKHVCEDEENANTWYVTSIFRDSYSSSFLGHYSSKEKALKVLDMIQLEYQNSCYTEISPHDGQTKLILNNLVFEMPEDSEV